MHFRRYEKQELEEKVRAAVFVLSLKRGTLAPYAVLAAAFLPYAAAFGFVAKNILVYGARASQTYLQKPGGLASLVDASRLGRWTFSVALLAAVVWALRETRHLELSRACLVLFLVQLTFSPA